MPANYGQAYRNQQALQRLKAKGVPKPINKAATPSATPGGPSPTLMPMTSGTPPTTYSAPQTTNTAEMDPTLSRQLARYDERLSAAPERRAIQQSTLGIQDAAALSAADAKGIMSRRGTLNSGAGDTFLNRNVFAPAQRQAAGAAAQIAQAGETRRDNLVMGGTPLAVAPGNMNISNRNLALNQQGQAFNQGFQTQNAAWDQAFQAQQAQQRANDEAAARLAQLYSPYLTGGPVPPGVPLPSAIGVPAPAPYAPAPTPYRGHFA